MPTKFGTALRVVLPVPVVAVAVLPLLPVVLSGWQAVPAPRMAMMAAVQASALRLMVPPGFNGVTCEGHVKTTHGCTVHGKKLTVRSNPNTLSGIRREFELIVQYWAD